MISKFSAIFTKRINIHDFYFAFRDDVDFPKRKFTLGKELLILSPCLKEKKIQENFTGSNTDGYSCFELVLESHGKESHSCRFRIVWGDFLFLL